MNREQHQLRARWPDSGGGVVSPLGRTSEGLHDYRGVPFPKELRKLTFRDADLSFVNSRGRWIEGCVFENCTIVRGDFQEFYEHRNRFEQCLFAECNFSRAGFGFFTSRYEGCVFRRCKFGGAVFRNAVFKRTQFLDMELRSLDFNASGFRECRFSGRLADVRFRGTYAYESDLAEHVPLESGLHSVDFKEASLSWITVSDGCALEDLQLPDDVMLLDSRLFLERFEASLEENFDAAEQGKARSLLRIIEPHAKGQGTMIITKTELIEHFGEQLGVRLFDHLVRAFVKRT